MHTSIYCTAAILTAAALAAPVRPAAGQQAAPGAPPRERALSSDPRAQLARSQDPAEPSVPLGERVEFPAAGISMAVPPLFKYAAPTASSQGPQELARALWQRAQGPGAMAVSLTVEVVDSQATPASVAGAFETLAVKMGWVSSLKMTTETQLPVAGMHALARLYELNTPRSRGVGVRVYFIRNLAASRLRLCYSLSVTATQSVQELMVPVLASMCRSIQLHDLRHSDTSKIGKLVAAHTDRKRGFSMMLPAGWQVVAKGDGVELRELDFLSGGTSVYRGQMVVASVDTDVTARSSVDVILGQFQQSCLAGQGLETTAVQRGPQWLSGLEAYQVIVRQSAAASGSGPASRPAVTRVAALRGVCTLAQGDEADPYPQRNAYLMIVTAPGKEPALAQASMNALAGGLKINLASLPVPASGPAKPSTQADTSRPADAPPSFSAQ
ncbi:MAG: hypothetical protein ABFD92_03580 [Planctomycetaceae bacterium]|nr:hypothetical protein [Planctomycetaceae bacterium]